MRWLWLRPSLLLRRALRLLLLRMRALLLRMRALLLRMRALLLRMRALLLRMRALGLGVLRTRRRPRRRSRLRRRRLGDPWHRRTLPRLVVGARGAGGRGPAGQGTRLPRQRDIRLVIFEVIFEVVVGARGVERCPFGVFAGQRRRT
jgi:hypothetical protein